MSIISCRSARSRIVAVEKEVLFDRRQIELGATGFSADNADNSVAVAD